MPAIQYNASFERGTDFTRVFQYRDENRDPVDLTNWGVRFRMAPTQCEPPVLESLHIDDGTEPTAAEGFVVMFLEGEQTEDLDVGSYFFTIDLLTPVGDPEPFVEGYLQILPES